MRDCSAASVAGAFRESGTERETTGEVAGGEMGTGVGSVLTRRSRCAWAPAGFIGVVSAIETAHKQIATIKTRWIASMKVVSKKVLSLPENIFITGLNRELLVRSPSR